MKLYKFSALAGAVIFSAFQAHACSCARANSAAEQAERHALIFVGTVSETTGKDNQQATIDADGRISFPGRDFGAQISTVFKTSTILKGPASTSVTLHHSAANGANCGERFQPDQEYFLLAYQRKDGTFATSSCSRPQFSRAEFEAILPGAD